MGTEDDTGELSERVKALETLIAFFIGNMEEFDPYILEGITRHLPENIRNPILENLILRHKSKMEKGIRFSIKNDVDNLRYKFDFLEKEQKNLQKEFHAYLVSRSMGQNPDDLPLNRYIPIQVYLSEDGENKIYRMSKAIKNFSEEFGLSISDEFPSQTGFWLKKWFGKTKDAITQIELQEIFQKMEHALEVHTLGIDQAKIDKAQAEAAGVLLKELRETQNAACQIGSLLLVKVTDNEGNSNVFCRTLNSNEMIFLGKNQHVLKKPNEIFESLKNANDELLGLPDRKA